MEILYILTVIVLAVAFMLFKKSEEKLNFLYELFQNGKGKSQKEIMAFFLPMMKKAKSQNLDFTPNEISTCIQAIKKHSTPEELSRIDKLLQRQQQ
mgnify:CR=1 FL=1